MSRQMTFASTTTSYSTAAYLSEEHQLFRRSLRKFLQKEAVPFYLTWEKEGIIPRSFWKKLGEQGFLCPWADPKYGGVSGDFAYSAVLVEELERAGGSLAGVSLHSDIVVPYLAGYGNEQQRDRWLRRCVNGDLITAIAMTEPGAGSDLAAIQTTAIREGNHYILNGQKTFISNGIHADLVIVVCKTNPRADPPHKGMSLLVVEKDTPGFSKGRKLDKVGLHALDTAELFFEDARVPAENLLGEEGQGFRYLMEQLQQERLIVALGAQVACERMLEQTLEYVKSRQAFGKPLSSLQSVQFRMAEMATEVAMGRTFVDHLIAQQISGQSQVSQVSMAKWRLTETAKKIAAECMQLHGGYGYMEEYEIARRYRDIAVTSIYAGSNEIMKSIIAREMGL